MGAGTNVQDLIIASHDLDAPWRPRDLTQRSGRTVRQGNQNEAVHIYRYVTENTFDAYNWELLERKQKFISQIMTEKSPVRSCEDVDGVALSYAEIKALATGNPHIKEKMEVDIEVSKLKLLEANYKSQIFDLQDKIAKEYPREIALQKELIEDAKADIEAYRERQGRTVSDKFAGMTVKGIAYAEKAKAGEALIEACRNSTAIMPVEIGEYMEFPVKSQFDVDKKEYKVILQGRIGYFFYLGEDAAGNITRLNNTLDGMEKGLENYKSRLSIAEQKLETAKEQVKMPFEKEEELKAKTARLAELDKLLDIGEKDTPVVLDEDEREREEVVTQKNRELEHER
jgi:superfamily II DNA/RNA helicase